mmetsp:Transcript_119742/g.211700  ORF Transcript_119742/g.211700 Transcript_119742/m.211700 type:complete len:542 (+) Transcript_119742:70-1695(+)
MASVTEERACRNGCGWCAFGKHKTCCTSCKGPDGPHAHDCLVKNKRLRPVCSKGCGRPAFGSFHMCCRRCTGSPDGHSHDCATKCIGGTSSFACLVADSSQFDTLGVMSYTHVLADGTAGKPALVDIVVRDGRPALRAGRIKLTKQGFTLKQWPTKLSTSDFYTSTNVTSWYYREQEELIKQKTGASQVIVLNHIVRNAGRADDRGRNNPFAGGGSGINGYANVVHTDYRARRSVQKFYEQASSQEMTTVAASGVPNGKYMLINTWRNISDENPIYNNTLACCDQQTVSSPDDYVSVDVPLTAQTNAEQYRLASHTKDKHSWYYFPRMTKDEVLIFTQFDSDPNCPARFCFHTAFNDPTVDPALPQRESVECRVIAFFPTPDQPCKDSLINYVQQVHPGNVGDLLKQLAQGAANGLLQPGELEDLVDKAAYTGAQNDDFIRSLCIERHIEYRPYQWEAGRKADKILKELEALKTYERTAFLKGSKSDDRKWRIDPKRLREDVSNLRMLFPDLEPDSVDAVYRGFGGNFETTFEMLSLALAE